MIPARRHVQTVVRSVALSYFRGAPRVAERHQTTDGRADSMTATNSRLPMRWLNFATEKTSLALGAGILLLTSFVGAAVAQSTISSRFVGRPSVIVDLSVLDKFGPAPTLPSLLRRGSTSLAPGTAARAPGQLLAPPKTLPRSQLTIPKSIATKRPAAPPPKPRVAVPKPVAPTPPAVAAVPKALTIPKPVVTGGSNIVSAAVPPPAAPATTVPKIPAAPKAAAKTAEPKIAAPAKAVIPDPPEATAVIPDPPEATAKIPSPPKATAAVPQAPVVTQRIPKAPSPPAASITASGEQLAARTSTITISDDGNKVRILFGENSSILPEAAASALEALAQKMNSDRKLRILLYGFAGGAPDTPSKARRLSLFRALAVRTQLMKHGVRSTRMQLRALGNRNEEGPPDRVDIVVAN